MLNTTVRARIDETLKNEVEHIFKEIGLSTSQAINLFLKKVVSEKGIPFDLKVSNQDTFKALDELKSRDGATFNSVEELFNDLDD